MHDIAPGMLSDKITHKGMRKGPILIKGKDRNQLKEYIEIIKKTLIIKTRTEDGDIKNIIWD